MSPPLITALDRQLATKGEPVTYHHEDFYGGDVTVETRAFVRGYRPEEIVSGITFDNALAIVTPTDLVAAGIEPQKGAALLIAGKRRAIQALGVFRVNDTVIRYEMQVA